MVAREVGWRNNGRLSEFAARGERVAPAVFAAGLLELEPEAFGAGGQDRRRYLQSFGAAGWMSLREDRRSPGWEFPETISPSGLFGIDSVWNV